MEKCTFVSNMDAIDDEDDSFWSREVLEFQWFGVLTLITTQRYKVILNTTHWFAKENHIQGGGN